MDFEAFKTRCKEKGYSASSLVTELGISKSNITNWRNGGILVMKCLLKFHRSLSVL